MRFNNSVVSTYIRAYDKDLQGIGIYFCKPNNLH